MSEETNEVNAAPATRTPAAFDLGPPPLGSYSNAANGDLDERSLVAAIAAIAAATAAPATQ